MAARFSVSATFKAINKISAPVSRMQKSMRKFTRSATRGLTKLNRLTGKIGAGLKRGATVGAAAVVSLGVALKSILTPGADFEQAITNVGAVTLQTRDQIAALEKQALQLGRTTKFTATEAANAMEIMARAGFKTNEILAATPAVLAAAAASGLEIAEVADVVSNALKGMGLDTSRAADVADILALASSRTNSSIGSLGESLKNVASTARQLNIPIEDTVAAIALLQDVGLDASVAGSAFNVMLTKMAKPSKAITKQMRQFGISFKDAEGNMLPLQKVLEQLSIASKKAGGNFDKIAFLADLVGLRGQKAAANLADLFESGRVGELTKTLENAAGSAKKMADIRMNTVQGSLLLLGSAVDAVQTKIFGLQGGPLKKLIDRMVEWVGANEDLIATNVGEFIGDLIGNLKTIGIWIERIAKGVAIFIAFSLVVKTATIAMTAFNLVMMLNPFGLMIIGVTALIAGFVALIVWIDDIAAGFEGLHPILRLVLAPLELIIRTIKGIKDIGSFLGNKLGGALFDVFGGGDDESSGGRRGRTRNRGTPQVVTPQERTARTIDEQRTTSTAEVTIKDETGRAEVTGGALTGGVQLQPSGAM